MSLKIKSQWVLLLMSLLFVHHLAAQSKVGTTAAPFLGIHVGPKAVGMGGAFTAMANDATSLFYNPGGISRSLHSQAMFSHTNWLVGSKFTWFGITYKLNENNAIGVSLTQLDYGEEEVTTIYDENTGEFWNASDIAATLAYARNLSERFSIGGSFKYIQEKIWHEKATAFAVDVGLLFITEFNDMKLGMSISNFGSDMQMSGRDLLERIDLDEEVTGHNETIVGNLKTDVWPLPLFFRVGLAMDVLKIRNNRFTVALDAVRPSDNTETINIGSELAIMEMFFLRGGYKSLFRDDSEEGLTLGVGFNVQSGNAVTIQVDYAYADFGLFEEIQMLSIGLKF